MFREDKSGPISLVTGTEVITYIADNLPPPRLISYEEIERVLSALGYNVFSSNAKRDSPLKNKDFLVDSTHDYLHARNRGYGVIVDIDEERLGAHTGWQIKITGKDRNEVEKIADALKKETYSEAKKLIDTKIISEEHYYEILKKYGIE